MINITNPKNCCGCFACVSVCPKKCIGMNTDSEGFWYPEVDGNKCVHCSLCEKVCPIINKWIPDSQNETSAIAAYNKDTKVRLSSSSGGIFTAIANWIISQNGVVFGAAFNESFEEVHHIYIDSTDDIVKLQGSKYVQSKIGNSYIEAKRILDSGRIVLYSGTPCQISGLYSFLRKDYSNLYTQDIICHGVPSPMLWKKYLYELEEKHGANIKMMNFRNKKKGWKAYSVHFRFKNNSELMQNHDENPYIKIFLSDVCLRRSCYSCVFKSIKRQADITLADFWGIQNVIPNMDDDMGTSAVLLHSNRGQRLIEQLVDQLVIEEIPINSIIKFNPSINSSAPRRSERKYFFKSLSTVPIDIIAKKIPQVSLKTRVVRKIKKFLKASN